MKTSKNMTNAEIAVLFNEVAAALEVKSGDFFRRRAYQNAAASIEHAGASLKDLWEQEALESVPGIGPGIKNHLTELFTTGRIALFEQELEGLPEGMFALLPVEGIGPKNAYKLAGEFNLTNRDTAISDLIRIAEAGRIRILPTFGEKSEQEILKALRAFSGEKKRMLLPEAFILADEVVTHLKKHPAVLEVEVLGSLRRQSPTVGDIDVAVATEKPQEVMDHFKTLPSIRKILSTGEVTTMVIHNSGREIDVKTQSQAKWGSMLQHYTGSKLHNIKLRTLAKQKGWSLSENGIKKDGQTETFATEEAFYRALDMSWIPPQLREDSGEIEAALKNTLPELVRLEDIRGDFHIHTDINSATSHDVGSSSVVEILDKTVSLGYRYIGLSDHNPRMSGLSTDKRIDLIAKRNRTIEEGIRSFETETGMKAPRVYKGLEVDIRPDGSLTLEGEVLNLLDYAIVSIHSRFDMETQQATERVLKALSHPKVKIFGHPTGRLINRREGLDYDWDRVFDFCRARKIWLEINASPDRLDLPEQLIRRAIGKGVQLVINTDSHDISQMDLMVYGVTAARRGWAEKKDIVNCRIELGFFT